MGSLSYCYSEVRGKGAGLKRDTGEYRKTHQNTTAVTDVFMIYVCCIYIVCMIVFCVFYVAFVMFIMCLWCVYVVYKLSLWCVYVVYMMCLCPCVFCFVYVCVDVSMCYVLFVVFNVFILCLCAYDVFMCLCCVCCVCDHDVCVMYDKGMILLCFLPARGSRCRVWSQWEWPKYCWNKPQSPSASECRLKPD